MGQVITPPVESVPSYDPTPEYRQLIIYTLSGLHEFGGAGSPDSVDEFFKRVWSIKEITGSTEVFNLSRFPDLSTVSQGESPTMWIFDGRFGENNEIPLDKLPGVGWSWGPEYLDFNGYDPLATFLPRTRIEPVNFTGGSGSDYCRVGNLTLTGFKVFLAEFVLHAGNTGAGTLDVSDIDPAYFSAPDVVQYFSDITNAGWTVSA